MQNELDRARSEIGIMTSMTLHDKDIITAQKMELDAASQKEVLIADLNRTIVKLQDLGRDRDATITSLKQEIHTRQDTIHGLRTAMKFSDLTSQTRLNKTKQEMENFRTTIAKQYGCSLQVCSCMLCVTRKSVLGSTTLKNGFTCTHPKPR